MSGRAPGAWIEAPRLSRVAAWAALFVFLVACNARVTGTGSLAVAGFFAAMVALCWSYGTAMVRLAGTLVSTRGAAFEILAGFLVVNTLLFVLTLATPLGTGGNCVVLGIGAALLLPYVRRAPARTDAEAACEPASLACIVVCGSAALLWTRDLQPLTQVVGDGTVFRAWPDMFIHAREISMFGASHGAATLSDIRVAGSPAPLYHVASYIASAAITSLTPTSALDTFASFQLPVGILLAGLAAYALGSTLFGAWPGAIAAIAVTTAIDPYQQGLGIRLLSYHFMSQVNVGTLYGIACVCIAWILVIEGCRCQRLLAIVCGYAVLLVSLTYKAHLFVANAYLLMIYPCLFYTRVRPRWRVATAVAFTAIFVSAVVVSQQNERVPTLRLDGSGLSGYVIGLLDAADAGPFRDAFVAAIRGARTPKVVGVAAEALMIGLATFGVWLVVFPVVAWRRRGRWPAATLWFPVLVVANYFAMTLGLALDSRRIGVPEELLNRPAAWAYFVVVVCSVGAISHRVRGRETSSNAVRVALASAIVLALAVVSIVARNLQTYPAWDSYAGYGVFNRLPTCYVDAGLHIRRHAAPGDLIQDDAGDPRFVLTAVAERQAFVVGSSFGGTVAVGATRLADVAELAASGDASRIVDFMRRHGIAWYLMRAPTVAASAEHVAFACGDYRLLRALPVEREPRAR